MRIESSDFLAFSGVENVSAGAEASTISVSGRTVSVSATGASTCTVTSLEGKAVASAAGNDSYTFCVDALNAGVYIVTVSTATGTVSDKIFIR